jgi:hypothetical protein
MSDQIRVYLEVGERRVFAAALDWPGWCRGAKTPEAALQALVDYGPRFRDAVGGAASALDLPADVASLTVVEEVAGNATTDFGAPAMSVAADDAPLAPTQAAHLLQVLEASWGAFDATAAAHTGTELRKGPRGGGRDVEAIVMHVLQADAAYLNKIGSAVKRDEDAPVDVQMDTIRQAMVATAAMRARGEDPPRIPKRGSLWPVPYAVRRSAWHALDHAWEIEDRLLD